ncbi:MAG: hypothetical protein Q8T09_12460 [Candidatus Melainabacteria bacterium]|nr:hypothetical protein [Candidatus Melainabacteria bacterium]
MSNPFNIELSENFPRSERATAKAELSIFNAVMDAQMGLFKQAWSGWPSGEQPRAGRSDAASQALLDAGMSIAFEDLWRGQQR